MNTSMTINATAAWLLALYVATAERQGANPRELRGTTQNDILKEFLARGTYIFPPEPSLRLTADTIEYTVEHIPKWNPVNICSYHLQEAGATPVQEIGFTLANAFAVLDRVQQASGDLDARRGRADLLLRQRRHPLHRRDVQAEGVHAPVGPLHGRTLRRRPTPRSGASATACR